MKWVADVTTPQALHCEITIQQLYRLDGQFDSIEYWLVIFEKGEELYDSHQDTLESVQRVAFKKYAVPVSAWRKVA